MMSVEDSETRGRWSGAIGILDSYSCRRTVLLPYSAYSVMYAYALKSTHLSHR